MVFRLAGIPIRIDSTLMIAAAIVVWSFWLRFEPTESAATAGGMALVASLLLLASLLAHELAHALEARHRGQEVQDITLHLFGGATRIVSEVSRPADEFALTAVGPWTSIVVGCAFGLVAYGTARAGVGPAAEVAGELGWLNVLLGLFNLLPGAPLDGGRLLDAAVWRVTRDRWRAERIAAGSGQVTGFALVAIGVAELLYSSAGFVRGFWLVLIGWFLVRAATEERRSAAVRARLRERTAAADEHAGRPGPAVPARPLPRQLARLGAVGTSVAVVMAAAAVIPMPVLETSPGPALDIPSVIETTGPSNEVHGKLLLTSIHIDAPTLLGVAQALLESDHDLYWQSSLIPPGIEPGQYEQSQLQVFRDSVQIASAVALRAAGYPVRVDGSGAVVIAVQPSGPAYAKLRVGDIITAMQGSRVATASDLLAQLSRIPPGATVTLAVERGEAVLQVALAPAQQTGLDRPLLGIAIQDASPEVQLPFTIRASLTDIGGPSAGLMTAISVYAKTTGTNLTGGRIVAGTGTIDAQGNVGPIGGVSQKVIGAVRAGATVFLAPSTDAAAARRAAAGRNIQVIPVANFDQAIAALKSIADPGGAAR